jgi:hypothetical protein
MKRQFLFILLGLIPSTTVLAEEMVVHLTSGNAVVIQYTGTIQGVTFKGKSDAIAGVDLPTAVKPAMTVTQQPVTEKQEANTQSEKVGTQQETGAGIRFKWAEPIGED